MSVLENSRTENEIHIKKNLASVPIIKYTYIIIFKKHLMYRLWFIICKEDRGSSASLFTLPEIIFS